MATRRVVLVVRGRYGSGRLVESCYDHIIGST